MSRHQPQHNDNEKKMRHGVAQGLGSVLPLDPLWRGADSRGSVQNGFAEPRSCHNQLMVFGRKRYYAGRRGSAGRRPRKRFRSRSRFSRRRGTSYSSRSGAGVSAPLFRSRKMSKRSWKSALYRSTMFKSHYRSLLATANSLTTATLATTSNVYLFPAINGAFWTNTGGLLPLDSGATTDPVFTGDAVIRGGLVRIVFTNPPGDVDPGPINLSLYLVKARKGSTTSWTNPTAVTTGWDPTVIPEFREDIGTVVFTTRKVILQGDTFAVQRRLPVQKVDQNDFAQNELYNWMVVCWNQVADTCSFNATTTHNLAFSADATVAQ